MNAADRETATERSKDAGEVLGTPGKKGSSSATGRANTWSIVLAVAPADAPEIQVVQLLAWARASGVPDAYIERRGKSMVIATGSYAAATDPAAREDLARIQAIEVEGERPFERALISPPPFEALPGSMPEFDLSRVKEQRPKAKYTLQVAVYQPRDVAGEKEPSKGDLEVVRAAAEKAVVELRREGEEAYYYHGPRRSMVTVGVFTDKDYDSQHGRESTALRMLHEKYPYNLVNGATLKVRTRGQTVAKEQPSFVVAIP